MTAPARRSPRSLALLLAGGLLAPCPAMAEPPPAANTPALAPLIDAGGARPLAGLAEGGSLRLPLAGAEGDYLRGELAVSRGRWRLDLVAADGRHLRRLAADVATVASFQFILAAPGDTLVATALAADALATLTLSARVPRAAQRPPAEPPLSPAIAALAARLAQGETTEAFWAEVGRAGTPLVESAPDGQRLLTFLARGARANVRLFGAPSGDHDWLARLGDSDVWFKSFLVPADTRLSYQLAPDVPELPGTPRERRAALLATARADPLNRAPWPAVAPDAYNQDSTVTLPDAPAQPGLAATGAPSGHLATFPFASPRLGNVRDITIYRPAGFDPRDRRNALLVVFDVRAYLTKVPTPAILDALIAEGRLPPVLAVFVSEIDPATRARELPGHPGFADMLADELLPRIRAETGADIPAARTILAGSSYGGLAAVTAALRRPERFANAIALSGSFWWHPPDAPADAPEHVADRVAREPARKLRLHLSAGLFERAHGDSAGILDTSRHLRDVLRAKGYDVSYREYAGGHDYLVWRGALADALLALAPRLDSP
ncbi:enterochelin esterase [Xanthobacter sp. V4C-4]|uniref:enterochelin esterase n=1 Tax=Xanthobacter cornucopiae TaxID=3119924 RepID=UPI003727D0E4